MLRPRREETYELVQVVDDKVLGVGRALDLEPSPKAT